MKICIVANGYPNSKEPRRGCFELDQAKALLTQGHEISILYVDGALRRYWKRKGIFRKEECGINVYGIYIIPFLPIRKILPFYLFVRFESYLFEKVFSAYVKEKGNPDIIYAHYMNNMAGVIGVGKRYNVPIVGIEHWSVLNQQKLSSDHRYLGEIAYNGVCKLLAVSNSLANSIYEKFGKKSIVVNNMLGQEFANAKMIDKTDSNKFCFIAVGSLIPVKGFDILIEAFHKAKLNEKDCELIIIGDGKDRDKLNKQIEGLSLSKHVSLVGYKNKDEIICYLRKSNTFVLSSRSETFSVVCIEALSIGVPVIATACGGPEEFIKETDGLLVKPGSVEELSSAMLQMYHNYKNYDRLAISEDCKKRFSPSVIAKQLTEIFEEVVDSHKNKKQ